MQAIHTKYIGPTNTRGSRIKATCDAGTLTIPYSYDKDDETLHREAAQALCAKLTARNVEAYGRPAEKDAWQRPFVTGGLKSGGYAHVFID